MPPVYDVAVPAATGVVGYDMLTNVPEVRSSGGARIIVGAALLGSAAAADSEVELRVGAEVVARLLNITTGLPTNDHIQPIGIGVMPGAPVSARITDAPATNPLNLRLILRDL